MFWIPWRDFLAHFDSLHLNWDPAVFSHRTSLHVRWDAAAGPRKDAYSLGGNPQFALRTEGPGEVMVLLSKHVLARGENLDFITLLLFEGMSGGRVYYPGGAAVQGEYVDR